MQIKCLRCKEQFEISKEQLVKIKEIVIGKTFRAKDYLKFFHTISGECKDGKGHDFVFTDAFTDKKKAVIQYYDEINKYMEASKESLKLMETREKELSDEREKLVARLDKIRDEVFTICQNMNDISLVKIPGDLTQMEKILDEFEDLCGTREIGLWKDVVVPKAAVIVPEVTKKEDKK